jgi:hypothetical protein
MHYFAIHGNRQDIGHSELVKKKINNRWKVTGTFVAYSTALKQLLLQCLNQHQSGSHQELEIPNESRLSNKDNGQQ